LKLRNLNLSFNRISKIEGLQNLHMLEVLELGKNYISDTDAL
jgi:Leucine-rich repeat (LRR) protein